MGAERCGRITVLSLFVSVFLMQSLVFAEDPIDSLYKKLWEELKGSDPFN